MSFPTIGKAFSQHFMSYAHIFMNICYLGVFYLSILNCIAWCIRCTFECVIFTVKVFNTIESGRSLICIKTSIYCWKYSVGKNKKDL